MTYKGVGIGDYVTVANERFRVLRFYIRTRKILLRHIKSSRNMEVSCELIKESTPSILFSNITTCIGVVPRNRKKFV